MANNLSKLSRAPQLALLFTIVGVSAATLPAFTEENTASLALFHRDGSVSTSQAPIVRPDPAGSVLKARWGVRPDEYVLDGTGQLRQSVAAYAALTSAEFNQYGSVSNSADTATEQHHSGSVFGASDDTVTSEAHVPDCGPSPASPEEIRQLVTAAAQRHDVDTTFALAITWAESNFDQNRNSPKGARGPMQLMPATASRFGVEDVCDPASNIEGGVRYLRELTEEFRNPLLVAAAYNAGEGCIREYGGIPPFDETVGYVAKVVNYQLGLPDLAPTRGRATVDSMTTSTTNDATPETGVITNATRRQWVGGVMQF